MPIPRRGEIWWADLGLAAKRRPVLIVTVAFDQQDYALLGVVPHTTSPRGSQFEVRMNVSGLKSGAFNIQGFFAVPPRVFDRRILMAPPELMAQVEDSLERWLNLKTGD